MNLLTLEYNQITQSVLKEMRVFDASTKPRWDDAPYVPWFWQALLGVPRGINAVELRQYAKSAWVQMVKSTIKKQIMTTEWDVINSDEEDETDYTEDIDKTKQLLNYPNENGDTFWSLWGMFADDVLDLDAGVIWKGRNVVGELVQLLAYDGSKFLKKINENGVIEGYYQYSYKAPASAPKEFEKKDLIYGQLGSNTDQFPYGWSPLQSIQQIVEVMIQSDRWNKEFFKNNAIPDGLVNIAMEDDALQRFQTEWEQKMKGQAHKLAFINTPDLKYTPMALTNKDMQWLDGQKWYFHVVFGAFGLSPAEVGFYEDVNRASQEGQERVSVKNAIRPYYTLIEEKINREIIPDLVGHDKIKFTFYPSDDEKEKLEFEQQMGRLNSNVITINEVRAAEGLDPVEWGDQPFTMHMQDRTVEMGLGGNDNLDNNKPDKEKEEKPKEKEEEKEKEKKKARNWFKDSFVSFMKNGKRGFRKDSDRSES